MGDVQPGQNVIILSDVTESGLYIVLKVEGSEVELRRLNQIGLMPGMRLEVVSSPQQDMMVVKVGGARMALSRGTTKNVWVKFRKRI